MARRSTGGVVIDTRRKSPVFALRFRASGRRQFVTLGSADEGWTRKKAEDALRHTLSDVERGIWRPPDREPAPAPVTSPDPLFHEFATRWYADNEPGWEEKTRLDYSWQLSRHLLPAFATFRLSQIDAAAIDRYKAAKLREGRLGPTSINKTITRLAQILEVACEYGLVDKNPAKGRHRKVKASKPAPVWLDRAEHLRALPGRGWPARPAGSSRWPAYTATGAAVDAPVRRLEDRRAARAAMEGCRSDGRAGHRARGED